MQLTKKDKLDYITGGKSKKPSGITKSDVRGVVVSEKHDMNFYVFLWRKAVSSYM